MFWSAPADSLDEHSPFGDRMRDALALARALLTLEDDYDVDWDFGPEGDSAAAAPHIGLARALGIHESHRRPIGRRRKRRAGAPAPARQVCTSPLPLRSQACRQSSRAR
jgi:hypothetical protein